MHNHCSAIDPAISRQVMSRRQVAPPSLLSSSMNPFPQTSLLQQTNSLGVVTGIPGALTLVSNLAPQMTSLASAGASAAVLLSSRLASLSSALASAGAGPNIASSIASVESVLRAGTTTSPPSNATTVTDVTSSTAQSSVGGGGGSSSPSAGLIAGAVIGSVAALALIGIFVLLFLRHRRGKPAKTNETEQVEKAELEGQGISRGKQELGEAEKPELATKANAWELQGNGAAMDAGNAHGGTGPWELPGHAEQMRGSLPAGQR
ncbi:hypothetical protein FB567DRAFT_602555 [Paraphoma chrysanthemicola]|uniref:Uncharacterized protein n=1 Tax=Paraphoma chrysanthemicola TaxID=798071 RepID=A0A8K0VY07_9PLEO|nr:hypothetical protein FB567DRAFT_602555 [Paraphoma chrysanthemicola]